MTVKDTDLSPKLITESLGFDAEFFLILEMGLVLKFVLLKFPSSRFFVRSGVSCLFSSSFKNFPLCNVSRSKLFPDSNNSNSTITMPTIFVHRLLYGHSLHVPFDWL